MELHDYNSRRQMKLSDSFPEAADGALAEPAKVPGQIVLVLQGGGAPGVYQAGAYHALHEAGIEPDWVIGTSIGAINGAIIAGNEVAHRLERLQEFWAHVETRLPGRLSHLTSLVAGVPGFYRPNPALAWGVEAEVGIERAALYSVDPLKKLLPELVDFDLVNAGMPRFTLGLVSVRSGQIRYFDSKQEMIGLDHVLGSAAIPPSFPAVRINGEPYWDGGIYSNTPIEVVFDDNPRKSSVVFAVQIWHARGPEPEIHRASLHAPERYPVRQPLQESHRAPGTASPHASHRARTRQHAPRRAQEHARSSRTRQLGLRDRHASHRDQR